ncbi:MAG: Sulfotransferase domain [Rhodobacteraceae bacterium HLUCCA08]|nr:MAG: Sulfotransferase domain [Rhodobacteraceae bacterium HLUCCA08]
MHHIIIKTSGRSGSHRLHDFLDYHERTNCRSEIARNDTRMGALPQQDWPQDLPGNFTELWVGAMRDSALRHSDRDRMMTEHKAYFRPFPTNLEVRLFRKPRLRRALYGIRGYEWKIPRRWLRPDQVDRIVPVIKGRAISWLEATHDALPDQYVVHGLRSPFGYLNSWWNRFVKRDGRGPEWTYDQVKALAAPILDRNAARPLADAFSLPELIRGRLWLWRELNGRMHASLCHSPRYLLLDYDDVSADPVAAARQIYAHCQLDFDDRHAARITGGKKAVFNNPHSEKLDEAMMRDVAADALDGFALADRYLKT